MVFALLAAPQWTKANRPWTDAEMAAAIPYPLADHEGDRVDGQQQVVCASSYAYSDGNSGMPYPVGVGCDQTGGTSGVPWILAFGSGYYLNGNMSYRYIQPNHPNKMFSPYFGDGAYNLWFTLVNAAP